MNFDNYAPYNRMRRCNLSSDGKVLAYYGEPGFSYSTQTRNVMVEIPKFWYKKEMKLVNGERIYTFAISDKPEQGFKVHPAFFRDRDGSGVAKEVDFRYYAAFEGKCWTGGYGLRSFFQSDNWEPQVEGTLDYWRKEAEKNGPGWGIVDFNLLSAVQMLYLTEYGHFDTYSKLGRGITSASERQPIGRTRDLGNATGEVAGEDGKRAMSYRGIENWYGNVYEWIDGCYFENSSVYIGNANFNDPGVGYTNRIGLGVSGVTLGKIVDIFSPDFLFFIPRITESSRYDSHLFSAGEVVFGRVPRFGGHWASNSMSGGFCFVSKVPTESNTTTGARLAY